jgi:hypothetical protein
MLSSAEELGEWDGFQPKNKTVYKATEIVTFTGNEGFEDHKNSEGDIIKCAIAVPAPHEKYNETWGYGICNQFAEPTENVFNSWTNATENTFKVQNGKIYLIFVGYTIEQAKQYLKTQYNAGKPVQVAYRRETNTSKVVTLSTDKYQAWVDGSETAVQGDIDNNEHGAAIKSENIYAVTKGVTQ